MSGKKSAIIIILIIVCACFLSCNLLIELFDGGREVGDQPPAIHVSQ
jgi:hypothetical protein